MSKRKIATCCLVVDASVARAAGSLESTHPTGVLCRDFLVAVRGVCHRIAWTDAIKLEWDKHDSRFARQWRLSMLKLDKLMPVGDGPDLEFRHSALECAAGMRGPGHPPRGSSCHISASNDTARERTAS